MSLDPAGAALCDWLDARAARGCREEPGQQAAFLAGYRAGLASATAAPSISSPAGDPDRPLRNDEVDR